MTSSQAKSALQALKSSDYSSPPFECDIVMKGGITSGVVYPHAVCEIAKTYRFVNVGGTSAGAIAAAAAGAAEMGRHAPNGGFRALAELPEWISRDNNLFKLFQPQRRTNAYFRVAVAGLGGGVKAYVKMLVSALLHFPVTAAAAVAPGAFVIAILARHTAGWAEGVGIACVVGLTAVVLLLALALRFVVGLGYALPRNYFGLCTGHTVKRGFVGRVTRVLRRLDAPLTPWLTRRLEVYAGRASSAPLTVGDLKAAGVNLEFMTTNLTLRRPYRLPWDTREYFFDPQELRDLFPDEVVTWMEDNPPELEGTPAEIRESELERALLEPLRPFPSAEQLPVIVATRMSLSFPILLSAVPLWSIDRSLAENQGAEKAWTSWLSAHAGDWRRALSEDPGGLPQTRVRPERCWFSDGGISSNFPLQFFDAPLPRRPTFAINLRPFHPSFDESPNDESANVYLPNRSDGGLLEWWYRFPDKRGLGQVGAFLSAIVRTMQNRVDEGQMRVPGFRDRIAHVSLSSEEGGLNLNMPPDSIDRLTLRGLAAGEKLAERFTPRAGSGPGLSWDSHRWTRYRAALAALQTLLRQFSEVYGAPATPEAPSYEQLSAAPPVYPWKRAAQRTQAAAFSDELLDAAAAASSPSPDGLLHECAPRPEPAARIVPPGT